MIMLTENIKALRTDLVRPRTRRSSRKDPSRQLLEYAKLNWEPWIQDDPGVSLVPSDENMAAAAEASRTARSIMQLTKNQLVRIHGEAGFDDFAEVMGNLANTAQMLRAMIDMLEGAQGRMIVSACACLQNDHEPNYRRKRKLRA
jgi:hypothetical protein